MPKIYVPIEISIEMWLQSVKSLSGAIEQGPSTEILTDAISKPESSRKVSRLSAKKDIHLDLRSKCQVWS